MHGSRISKIIEGQAVEGISDLALMFRSEYKNALERATAVGDNEAAHRLKKVCYADPGRTEWENACGDPQGRARGRQGVPDRSKTTC